MRSLEQVMQAVNTAIEAKSELILNMGEFFWKNPESGYKEFKTSEFARKQFKAIGLPIRENLAVTGFRAELDTGKPGPTVAILGEMDSLIIPGHPECDKKTGCVHACGHHAQITALIATAMGLCDSHAKDELCGKIVFIGCPAEEGIELDYRIDLIRQGKIKSLAGKSQLIREGAFDDVNLALMNHLSNHYGYQDHNGSVNKRISVFGKSCHAATPWKGRNALNGANLIQHAIGLMRESLCGSDKIRIHGVITNGGTAVNIIPELVTMEYMVRAPEVKDIMELSRRFDSIVLHAAQAAECHAEVETLDGYMPLFNHVGLGDEMEKAVHFLHPDIAFKKGDFLSSCTDMGNVGTLMPVVHGYVPGGAGIAHGTDYYVANPYSAFIENAKIQALSTVQLLYGNGESARTIAAERQGMLSIPEYIRLIDGLNHTEQA